MRISTEKEVIWADGCSYMGTLPLVGVVKVLQDAKIDDTGRALAEDDGDEIQGAVKLGIGPFVPFRVNDLLPCGDGCIGIRGHAKDCRDLYKGSRQTFVLQLDNGNETPPLAGKLFQPAPLAPATALVRVGSEQAG
jgi:hypothetical protein